MEQYTKKQLDEKSKELAFLLRHDIDYKFSEKGWRSVVDLTANHNFTIMMLMEIVRSDKKGRYEFNEDMTMIRACQGHSVAGVNPDLREMTPPDILYHGTATRLYNSIKSEGIKKMSRNYVQLSTSISTALEVGKRHGTPVILSIDAKAMARDGIKFYLSNNGIWMTEFVNPKYII